MIENGWTFLFFFYSCLLSAPFAPLSLLFCSLLSAVDNRAGQCRRLEPKRYYVINQAGLCRQDPIAGNDIIHDIFQTQCRDWKLALAAQRPDRPPLEFLPCSPSANPGLEKWTPVSCFNIVSLKKKKKSRFYKLSEVIHIVLFYVVEQKQNLYTCIFSILWLSDTFLPG